MPEVQRTPPPWMQIRDHYAQLITSGELADGTRLPSRRDIATDWGVDLGVVQRAFGHLETERYVRSVGTQATYVTAERVRPGPQQRILYPVSEREEILAAELVTVPDYIVPILGVDPGSEVIRREWVSSDDEGPFMLSVSWFPGYLAGQVPELLSPSSIGEAVWLISERTGRKLVAGRAWGEARSILDDGREGPHLNLPAGYVVKADTFTWYDVTDCLEYGEYILKQGKTIEYSYPV